MKEIRKTMLKHSKSFMKDTKAEWGKHRKSRVVAGEAHIEFNIIEDTDSKVVGRYSAWGQKAWILEYGKGKLMDMTSPTVKKHMGNKELYNQYRNHGEVRTRESYDDLDGNKDIKGLSVKNFPQGLNTNAFAYNKKGKYKGKFLESPPYHIVKETIHKKGSAKEILFESELLTAAKKDLGDKIKLLIKEVTG